MSIETMQYMLSKLRPDIGCGSFCPYSQHSGSKVGWQGVQSHLGVHGFTWKIKTKQNRLIT